MIPAAVPAAAEWRKQVVAPPGFDPTNAWVYAVKNGNAWECVFCSKTFAGTNATKVKYHVAGLSGCDIARCLGFVPKWLRDAVKDSVFLMQSNSLARANAKRNYATAMAGELNEFALDVEASRQRSSASSTLVPRVPAADGASDEPGNMSRPSGTTSISTSARTRWKRRSLFMRAIVVSVRSSPPFARTSCFTSCGPRKRSSTT